MAASLIGCHCQAPYFRPLSSSLRGSRFSTWSALRLCWPPQALVGSDWRASLWGALGVAQQTFAASSRPRPREVRRLGQVEIWRNLGEKNFFSADASYSDAFGSYWTQIQLGRRITTRVSVGIEGGALGNDEYDSGRGGGFLRYHLDKIDLTVSGGASGNYYGQSTGGYAAFGFYTKF